MKNLLLLLVFMIGVSGSAQVIYTPGFFGDAYIIDGHTVGQTQLKAKLLEDTAAYNMWNQGSSNIAAGYTTLYVGSGLLGWGIGTNLGNSIVNNFGYSSGRGSGTIFIAAGGAGVIGGILLLTKGQRQREQALFQYNKGKSKVGWKPLMNQNGGGIAITLN